MKLAAQTHLSESHLSESISYSTCSTKEEKQGFL